jgi:GMP synthase (glutamine-hydrolysing)
MQEKVFILDFGSQYTQLIARRVREAHIFCEIAPYNAIPELDASVKAIILSGSPFSVRDENSPKLDLDALIAHAPVLGVCYGAQLLAAVYGGLVEKSDKREYGRAHLDITDAEDPLMNNVSNHSQIWMSHGDTIRSVGDRFAISASSDSIPVACFWSKTNTFSKSSTRIAVSS